METAQTSTPKSRERIEAHNGLASILQSANDIGQKIQDQLAERRPQAAFTTLSEIENEFSGRHIPNALKIQLGFLRTQLEFFAREIKMPSQAQIDPKYTNQDLVKYGRTKAFLALQATDIIPLVKNELTNTYLKVFAGEKRTTFSLEACFEFCRQKIAELDAAWTQSIHARQGDLLGKTLPQGFDDFLAQNKAARLIADRLEINSPGDITRTLRILSTIVPTAVTSPSPSQPAPPKIELVLAQPAVEIQPPSQALKNLIATLGKRNDPKFSEADSRQVVRVLRDDLNLRETPFAIEMAEQFENIFEDLQALIDDFCIAPESEAASLTNNQILAARIAIAQQYLRAYQQSARIVYERYGEEVNSKGFLGGYPEIFYVISFVHRFDKHIQTLLEKPELASDHRHQSAWEKLIATNTTNHITAIQQCPEVVKPIAQSVALSITQKVFAKLAPDTEKDADAA